VVIWLQVRRLFCDDPGCARATFAEQVPGLAARYARTTTLLAGILQHVAVAMAGRAGSRVLCAAASRSTLLRLVMAENHRSGGPGLITGPHALSFW